MIRHYGKRSGLPQEADHSFDPEAWNDAIEAERLRQEEEAEHTAALLLRLPAGLKMALTMAAAERTAATGERLSVNSLIVEILRKSMAARAKAREKASRSSR